MRRQLTNVDVVLDVTYLCKVNHCCNRFKQLLFSFINCSTANSTSVDTQISDSLKNKEVLSSMCDNVKESLRTSITEVSTKIDRLLSRNDDLQMEISSASEQIDVPAKTGVAAATASTASSTAHNMIDELADRDRQTPTHPANNQFLKGQITRLSPPDTSSYPQLNTTGTESWLDPTTFSSEIFPTNYQVFRKDRSDGYGGVFFACINTINCSQVTIASPCECIVCRVELTNSKVLIVITAYRPPNRDLVYVHNLCQIIAEIYSTYKNAVIWITGDFNLPDINWNYNSVTNNSYESIRY